MGLKHAALAVQNLDRALQFYCDHLDAKPYHVQDQDWAMVLVGTTSLSLVPCAHRVPPEPRMSGMHPAHLGFVVGTVEDVEKWHRRLSQVPDIQVAKMEEHRDGSVGFYFSDTEANSLELIAIPLHSKAHKPTEALGFVVPDALAAHQAWCEALIQNVSFHTHGVAFRIVKASELSSNLGLAKPYRLVAWSETEAALVQAAGLGDRLHGTLLENPELLEAFAARLVLS